MQENKNLNKLTSLLEEALLLAPSNEVKFHIELALSLTGESDFQPEKASQQSPSGHYLIPDYPNYSIDMDGRIFGIKRRKLLTPWATLTGHLRVDIRNKNTQQKKPYIHDLVMTSFRGPKPVGAVVWHLNDDHSDNQLENLAYRSQSENTADSIKNGRNPRKFSDNQIAHILELRAKAHTVQDLMELYPCSMRNMTKILTGSTHAAHKTE
jgi:hypothetical protein